MKRTFTFLLISIYAGATALAQKATITEKKIIMETYMFSDPNPVPDIEKNYPYFKFDGFTNKSAGLEWNMVVLENDFIKVFVNTDIGGKIWGAVEKSTGRDFLYYNDVVKFRDVAHRGAWTSGGLEYNFGIMSHVSTCATPQDYVVKENEDGSVSCIIGAIDLHTGTKWNVEINLQKDKAYVETRASWFNTGNLPVSCYHFMNAAAKSTGNLEFFYPGNHYIGHMGEVGDWPVENGRNLSLYENNNFGSYKSYHVLNGYAGYMGGYWHDDDFGFGNLHQYDEMPGKKIWIWGLADEGMIWEGLLTDTKGQYIEYQTGNLFNQPMFESSFTPFKHREFIPYDSEISTELWFPVKGTGGMVAASEYGVLNVVRKDGRAEILFSPLASINDELVIKSADRVILTKIIHAGPLELITVEISLNNEEDFSVELGDDLLYYTSDERNVIVDRPLYPNKDFNWESAIGFFTKGFELEKLQSYVDGGRANKKAHVFYVKSLKLDPAYAPALNRLAFSYYRRIEFDSALYYTLKSLSIDTYDAEANYLFGIINVKLGKTADAKSGFSIASKSTSYRSAAFTELAKVFLREKNLTTAVIYADKALSFNKYNITALEIKYTAYRLNGNSDELKRILEELYDLDKTSAFVAFEKARVEKGKNVQTCLASLITNELPAESYITLALKFKDFGLTYDCIDVLRAGPEHAIVLLLLSWLDVDNRTVWLKKGLNVSPWLVFPYRSETYEAIKELMKASDDWKLKYYASLILWDKDRDGDAKRLMAQCGEKPDFVPFYLAKAKLFSDEKSIADAALTKARSLDAKDWRVNLALADQYMKDKKYSLAAKFTKEGFDRNPETSILGIRYAESLLRQEEYNKAIAFLDEFEMIPYEGALEGRQVYHETLIRAAFDALKKSEYETAIAYAVKATLWPVGLGAGKPYNADERLENAIISYCYQKLGDVKKADEYRSRLLEYRVKDGQVENPLIYLQAVAIKKSGDTGKASELIEDTMKQDSDNQNLIWAKAMFEGSRTREDLTKKLSEHAYTMPLDNTFLLLADFLEIAQYR